MTKEIFISGGSQEPVNYSSDTDDNLSSEEFELPIDIARRGEYLIIKAPIVGATPTDISLTINQDIITIRKGEAMDNDNFDNYYLKECYWGAVERTFRLPLKINAAKAQASLQDGILRITLPIIGPNSGRSIKIN